MLTLDTFHRNRIIFFNRLQTNPTRDLHGPPTRHTLHHTSHTTEYPMIGCSASARGARASSPGGRRRSGWVVSKATGSRTSPTPLYTTHHARPTTDHTPRNLIFDKREGDKGFQSGGVRKSSADLDQFAFWGFSRCHICDRVVFLVPGTRYLLG